MIWDRLGRLVAASVCPSAGAIMADAASQVLLGSGLTILSQPLIQVGYESLPPTIGRNIFGGKYVSFLASFVMLSTLPASMGRSVDCSQA